MEGNAKIIRLIARDEALHLTGTQHMLNLLRSGVDDPEMAEIAEECKQECYDLFVQAAASIHGGTGWFQQQGQFPSARYTEIPVAPEALKFYKDGAPVLQRYMSFWLANFFDRMWVLVVALGALILPLSRVVPPLYVWRIRSRVYRWYGQLRTVEQALELSQQTAEREMRKGGYYK